jgi:Protein of unknown function (DUF2490).
MLKQIPLAKTPFILSLCLSIGTLSAQTYGLGSWNVLHLKYDYDDKWSFFGEAQLRSLKFYKNFHYYEYKGGVNYNAHKNVKLSLGAGSYQTYKEGGNFVLPKNNDEFRIWPQISIHQTIINTKIEQRYRAESRFTSIGYRNRFRYRFGISYPFGKRSNGNKTFQMSASNEIFFTDKEPYFERNRVLVALHFSPSQTTTLQIGYLHQFDYRINDETGRDFLVLGIYYELFRKFRPDRGQEHFQTIPESQ